MVLVTCWLCQKLKFYDFIFYFFHWLRLSLVTLTANCWHNCLACLLPRYHHWCKDIKPHFLFLKVSLSVSKTLVTFNKNEMKCQHALFSVIELKPTKHETKLWSERPTGLMKQLLIIFKYCFKTSNLSRTMKLLWTWAHGYCFWAFWKDLQTSLNSCFSTMWMRRLREGTWGSMWLWSLFSNVQLKSPPTNKYCLLLHFKF